MSKPKAFRPWNLVQTLLLPPSPMEWLPANHLAFFFLLDLATELDLSAIDAVYEARDPLRATAAQATSRQTSSGNWMPSTPPAGRRTASGLGHQGGQQPGIWMHGAVWTARSDPKTARRSTPYTRSLVNGE